MDSRRFSRDSIDNGSGVDLIKHPIVTWTSIPCQTVNLPKLCLPDSSFWDSRAFISLLSPFSLRNPVLVFVPWQETPSCDLCVKELTPSDLLFHSNPFFSLSHHRVALPILELLWMHSNSLCSFVPRFFHSTYLWELSLWFCVFHFLLNAMYWVPWVEITLGQGQNHVCSTLLSHPSRLAHPSASTIASCIPPPCLSKTPISGGHSVTKSPSVFT